LLTLLDALAGVGEARPAESWDELIWRNKYKDAAREVARLQHIIDCANTPLMRDVLRERDGLREQLDALTYAATEFRRMVEAPPALNADEHEDWQASMQAADSALAAALGVVGPPTNEGSALGQTASETRGGET
jgi:hypothetical protein